MAFKFKHFSDSQKKACTCPALSPLEFNNTYFSNTECTNDGSCTAEGDGANTSWPSETSQDVETSRGEGELVENPQCSSQETKTSLDSTNKLESSENLMVSSGNEVISSGNVIVPSGNDAGSSGNAIVSSRNEAGSSGNEANSSGNEAVSSGNEASSCGNALVPSENEAGSSGNAIVPSENEAGSSGNAIVPSGNEAGSSGNAIVPSGNEAGSSGNAIVPSQSEAFSRGNAVGSSFTSGNETDSSGNAVISSGNETVLSAVNAAVLPESEKHSSGNACVPSGDPTDSSGNANDTPKSAGIHAVLANVNNSTHASESISSCSEDQVVGVSGKKDDEGCYTKGSDAEETSKSEPRMEEGEQENKAALVVKLEGEKASDRDDYKCVEEIESGENPAVQPAEASVKDNKEWEVERTFEISKLDSLQKEGPSLSHETTSLTASAETDTSSDRNPGENREPTVCPTCIEIDSDEVDVHQCDYYIVGSPHVLKVVLRMCDEVSSDQEEEVGAKNKLSCICLSGIHLKCVKGLWTVEEAEDEDGEEEVIGPDDDLESLEGKCFHLNGGITTVFLKQERRWEVRVTREGVKDQDLMPSESPRSSPEPVHPYLTISEETSPHFSSLPRNTASPLILGNGTSTQFNGVPGNKVPTQFSDVHGKKTSTQSSNVPGNRASKQNSSVSRNETTVLPVTPFDALPSEVEKQIHGVVQELFKHTSAVSEDALDGSKYRVVEDLVCQQLCAALGELFLSDRRRLKRCFFHHDVVYVLKEFQNVSNEVKPIVSELDKLPSASDQVKLTFFVCECLNMKNDALGVWIEHVLADEALPVLKEYYKDNSYILRLSSEERRGIVREVHRFRGLPFKLCFPFKVLRDLNSSEAVVSFG